MDNILDEFEEEPLYFTFEEILTEIWTSPREVFRFIHERQYERYMLALLIIGGIYKAFSRATSNDLGDSLPLFGIIGTSILSGLIFGWLSAYIYAALISWTGGWLNGKADSKSILRVMAYGSIPFALALVLLIPQMIIHGVELFKENGDISTDGLVLTVIYYGAVILTLVLGIYTLVFYVIAVSEVQEFGIGKAFLNLLLPVLIFVVPILLLVLSFT